MKEAVIEDHVCDASTWNVQNEQSIEIAWGDWEEKAELLLDGVCVFGWAYMNVLKLIVEVFAQLCESIKTNEQYSLNGWILSINLLTKIHMTFGH